MQRFRTLGKLLGLSWADRLLLFEAALCLGVARLAILLLPFRWLAPRFGARMAESAAEEPGIGGGLAGRLAWAVRVSSRYAPWQTRCLVRAVAAKLMLKRRGLPSTLYLGLAKDGDGELTAHAWLRCGGSTLTGGRVGREYQVIAKFAEGGGPGSA